MTFILSYKPKKNLIEQVWKETRTRRFRDEVLDALEKVMDHLYGIIIELPVSALQSISGLQRIMSML